METSTVSKHYRWAIGYGLNERNTNGSGGNAMEPFSEEELKKARTDITKEHDRRTRKIGIPESLMIQAELNRCKAALAECVRREEQNNANAHVLMGQTKAYRVTVLREAKEAVWNERLESHDDLISRGPDEDDLEEYRDYGYARAIYYAVAAIDGLIKPESLQAQPESEGRNAK